MEYMLFSSENIIFFNPEIPGFGLCQSRDSGLRKTSGITIPIPVQYLSSQAVINQEVKVVEKNLNITNIVFFTIREHTTRVETSNSNLTLSCRRAIASDVTADRLDGGTPGNNTALWRLYTSCDRRTLNQF